MIPRRTALVALLCLAWILPGLLGHDPWKPDEGYTFGIVYELLKGGSWVVPHLAGEPFLEKPPFFYLVAAASAWLFSPPLPLHDAARLATGFFMAITFLFCGLTGRELNGEGRGYISTLLLLGCFGLVVRSHQLITDVALLSGFAIAYYGFALSLRRPAWGGFWLGTGIGIGFMSKGLLALGTLGILALVLPLAARAWRSRNSLTSAGFALLAASPWLLIWPIALEFQSQYGFMEWLWVNNFGRFLGTNNLGPAAESLHYLRILPWYAWPVWPVALWALWRARTVGFARPALMLPLTGFLVTFTVLTLASQARELYALPMLIPLVLLATPAADTLRRGAANAWYWFSVMGFTFFIGVAWFYWIGLELGVPARLHQHLHAIQPGHPPGFRLLPFTLGLAYTLAWFGILAGSRRSPLRPVIAWAAGITVIWSLIAILFIGWLDAGKSYRSMIVSMQQAMPAKYRCVSSRNLGEPQRAMLDYVAGIITHREEVPERHRDCDLLLVQGVPQEENVPLGPWQKIWEGSRPGDDRDERFRLYRKTEEPKAAHKGHKGY